MIRLPFRSTDAVERGQFLKFLVQFGIPAFLLLTIGELRAWGLGMIGTAGLVLLVVLNVPAIVLFSGLAFGLIERTATGLAHTMLGAGNLKPEPAHSSSESLAARGLYREAVQAFRARIAEVPDDNLARIKLAEIHRAHLDEPDEAERLYLEVRRQHPDPRHEFLATNLLIELYRGTGRRDRMMVELARFADRYRGTRAGRDAARALREMKEELTRRGEAMLTKRTKGTAVVTLPTNTQILITRAFGAPRHLVYKAWTTPELIKRWWSANRGKVTVAEVDLRVGGRWRWVMVTDRGSGVAFHGEYRELVPNERIVSTEVFEGMPEGEAVNTMTFAEKDGHTILTILVEHARQEHRDAHISSGMERGMQDAMDLLEQVALSLV